MKYLITNYKQYINENAVDIDPSVRKVLRAIYWLNINKGFYGELISHINVYISTIPKYKTMCTDCATFVACHPEFVQAQPDSVIRAVLIHEILHVIGQHNQRQGGRDNDLWNEACDYAINPIIHSDSSFGADLQFPKIPDGIGRDGQYNVLFEERFVGMRAEDIYDILISEGRRPGDNGGKGNKGTGNSIDKIDKNPIKAEEIENTVQRKNNNDGVEKEESEDEVIDTDITIDSNDTSSVGGSSDDEKNDEDSKEIKIPKINKNTEEMDIDLDKIEGNSGNARVGRNADKGDVLKGVAKEVTGATKKISEREQTDWTKLKERAMARNSGSLTEETRRLLTSSLGSVPVVNWKAELKKFFDHSLTGRKTVLPNKRLLSSGTVLFGSKKEGISNLKTIIAAIDTSASISEDQQKTFINEVMYLCKKYQADRTIIIYCSDDIDGVDIIKKGGEPDFSKMKTTGGNSKGFIPPFEWVESYQMRVALSKKFRYVPPTSIKPSVFIYLTDTGGSMPDKNKYGIGKYINKVIWFICSPTMYNTPPFGKVLYMPVSAIKKDS